MVQINYLQGVRILFTKAEMCPGVDTIMKAYATLRIVNETHQVAEGNGTVPIPMGSNLNVRF